MDWLLKQTLRHLLEEGIHIEFSVHDALLPAIIEWTHIVLKPSSNLSIFRSKLSFDRRCTSLNHIVYEYFLLVFT
jgi:hypothetical protein